MTRLEFEEIESFYDLISICYDVNPDICSDIYDHDDMEEFEFCRIREAINDGIISNLDSLKDEAEWCRDNLPCSDYCMRDDYGDWYEVDDGDDCFEEHKSLLRDFMEVNNLFDDEEEEEYENEDDTEFGIADFSVQELIRGSIEALGGK